LKENKNDNDLFVDCKKHLSFFLMDIFPLPLRKMSTMPASAIKKRKARITSWEILGGKQFISAEPVSIFDYVKAGNKGISKQSVIRLAEVMKVPMKDMATLLNISYKTLGRKKPSDTLNSLSSSLSIEIAETVAKGLSVFEDTDKLNRWLQKENRALQGKKPIDFLNTPTGIKMVNRLLGRIEEGIYT
jgi:putative toxin-antitoxin system antitoxin component (TIGR02293 family)